MPGPHEVTHTFWRRYKCRIKVRPKSLWRLVPLAGAIYLYRLGAHVTFRGEVKCLSFVELDDEALGKIEEDKEKWRATGEQPPFRFEAGVLLPSGRPQVERVSLPLEKIEGVGRTVRFDLGPFFLATTGDAQVYADIRYSRGDLFAFRVHEPGHGTQISRHREIE